MGLTLISAFMTEAQSKPKQSSNNSSIHRVHLSDFEQKYTY